MYKNWQELIKPKQIEIETESTLSYGKFVAEPLERGFGLTLGNALRRILLSSIRGAAITGVRMDGALHEFATIPGVREDVSDIILNLKEVKIKLHSRGPKAVKINAKGEGVVYAKDIVANSDVQVLNPDHVIATLSDDAELNMELTVSDGKGYVSAEKLKDENAPIGTIFLDASFSPVTKVNYVVSSARVGQFTDYDKLTLEVWTNGGIKPDDAMAFAAKILKEQLTVFINFDEFAEEGESDLRDEKPQINENLYKSVEELELSVRSANCLKNANIQHIWELVQRSEQEMLKTKNFGRKSLNEIKEILAEMGLSLGMKFDNFVPPEKPVKSDVPDEE